MYKWPNIINYPNRCKYLMKYSSNMTSVLQAVQNEYCPIYTVHQFQPVKICSTYTVHISEGPIETVPPVSKFFMYPPTVKLWHLTITLMYSLLYNQSALMYVCRYSPKWRLILRCPNIENTYVRTWTYMYVDSMYICRTLP